MFEFSPEQRKNALIYLSCFHIFVIAASNYLVQIPMHIASFVSTWGSPTYPFIFLCTDLTIRIFGTSLARKIIFCVMLPALILSYGISVIFLNAQWVGFEGLLNFNIFVARIALASFSAYIVGQLMDILVFNKLRQKKAWWVAPSASTIIGNFIDTVCFFSIAFFQSNDPFMAAHWIEIALLDYGFKILICGVFFLPLYGVILNYLMKRLHSYC